MFNLVKMYDARFYVVADRYEYPGTTRSMEVSYPSSGHDIDITKENIECYKLAKNSLSVISTTLDYESTIKLIEMGVDVENESIHKLMSLIRDLEEEEKGLWDISCYDRLTVKSSALPCKA